MDPTSVNLEPAFNITRASHVVLTSNDLSEAKRFYQEVVGLVVSAESDDTVYLRGIEESAHHSLELRRSDGAPACQRVGMRVRTDDDVAKALSAFTALKLQAEAVKRPFLGPALHVTDPVGIQLELCATMARQPRMLGNTALYKGAAALRLDHFQVLVDDVEALYPFYAQLGFRVSDYVEDADGAAVAAFLYRKNNPWDLVLVRRGPTRFHHFAYIVQDLDAIFRACDAAAKSGWPAAIERGPGRHGLGHSLYVYLRDPDGHRVELLPPPMQLVDLDEEPVRWGAKNGFVALDWGPPAPERWFNEASDFA